MKNNWQKDIHDRLGNYEKDAPKGLWEDIRKGTTDENGGYMHGHQDISYMNDLLVSKLLSRSAR